VARSHGKIHTTVWDDDSGFVALSATAKLVYFFALTQKKLTLAGIIEPKRKRWANKIGITTDDLDTAFEELGAAGYIVIDHDTEEVCIRTLVKHDFDSHRMNKNLIAGFWRQWEAIESEQLRRVVVEQVPADKWERLSEHAPEPALQIRRSDRLKPAVETSSSNEQSEPPSSLRPSPFNPPAAPGTTSEIDGDEPDATPEAAAVKKLTSTERTKRFHDAIDLLTARKLERMPAKTDPAGYERSIRRGKRSDHAAPAFALLDEDPSLTAEALADTLEPPAPPRAPDPAEMTVRAQQAEMERNARRARGEFDCEICQDEQMLYGVDDNGNTFAEECDCKQVRTA
jgi:hypothetical protein